MNALPWVLGGAVFVGFAAVAFGMILGVSLGLVAGYRGGYLPNQRLCKAGYAKAKKVTILHRGSHE